MTFIFFTLMPQPSDFNTALFSKLLILIEIIGINLLWRILYIQSPEIKHTGWIPVFLWALLAYTFILSDELPMFYIAIVLLFSTSLMVKNIKSLPPKTISIVSSLISATGIAIWCFKPEWLTAVLPLTAVALSNLMVWALKSDEQYVFTERKYKLLHRLSFIGFSASFTVMMFTINPNTYSASRVKAPANQVVSGVTGKEKNTVNIVPVLMNSTTFATSNTGQEGELSFR